MGFFSWETQDTRRSIPSIYSIRKTFKVIMIDNKGNKWIESSYEGYCVFGGKDFFELLAEMNGGSTKEFGIELYFSNQPCLSPNLIENDNWIWKNKKPKQCKYQGYFYEYKY
jgi:hypothetical protein